MILPEDQGWQFLPVSQSKGTKISRYFLFTRISIFRSLRLAGIWYIFQRVEARSQEKSRSLLLAPFLARYRSLLLSLRGLVEAQGQKSDKGVRFLVGTVSLFPTC